MSNTTAPIERPMSTQGRPRPKQPIVRGFETPGDLIAASVDDFKAVVDENLRGAPSREKFEGPPEEYDAYLAAMRRRGEALRHPDVVDRWYHQLVSTQKSVDGQLAAKDAEFQQSKAHLNRQGKSGRNEFLKRQEAHERWRAGSLRFKTRVEEMLMEARWLRSKGLGYLLETAVGEENARLLARVRELEAGIRRHMKEMSGDDGDEHDEGDVALWSLLPPDPE